MKLLTTFAVILLTDRMNDRQTAMLCVIDYFAKSFEVIQNDTLE